jgi:hypothetical protein
MKSLDSICWCGIILPAASNKQPGKPGRMIFYKAIALKSAEHMPDPNVCKIVRVCKNLLTQKTIGYTIILPNCGRVI